MSTEAATLELCHLVGHRVLDARAHFVCPERHPYDSEDASVVAYRLDGDWYWFQENPEDGYRSCMRLVRLATAGEIPSDSIAEFPPMMVTLRLTSHGFYGGPADILYAVNERTGLVVFEVGTNNTDDYYPEFVASWIPDGYTPMYLAATEPSS